jgi:hypothetical protein
MWRDKVDQHNTGAPAYEHIERIIVERASPNDRLLPPPDEVTIEAEPNFEDRPTIHPGRHWSE